MASTYSESARAPVEPGSDERARRRALGRFAARARRPGVITQLLLGILIGPSVLGLIDPANPAYGPWLDAVAQLGIILLIFGVGLGTRLVDLKRVGRVAMGVASAGVVTPLVCGTALLLALAYDWRAALFVGAAMVATSVGITAQVLRDLKILRSASARIILGAAVIDDVMGMVVLAIVGAVAAAGGATPLEIGLTVTMAIVFVALALFLGSGVVGLFTPRANARPTATNRSRKVLAVAFAVCLALSGVAALVGLAPIIGAFLAGVAFADVDARYQLRSQITRPTGVLAPIFFFLMGAHVSLGALVSTPALLLLALGLTALAAATKYVPCRLAALGQGRTASKVVGAGMIPRGEVGLIVASTGLAAGVLQADLFSVVVFMSIGTTLLGPPMLHFALRPPRPGALSRALTVARSVDLAGPKGRSP